MKRVKAEPKQRVLLICLIAAAVVVMFPIAVPAKTCTQVAYIGTSGLAILFAFTRIKFLLLPAVLSFLMLCSTFLLPLDCVLVRGQPFSVSWVRYEEVDPWSPGLPRDKVGIGYDRLRDSPQINGVAPRWILRICTP